MALVITLCMLAALCGLSLFVQHKTQLSGGAAPLAALSLVLLYLLAAGMLNLPLRAAVLLPAVCGWASLAFYAVRLAKQPAGIRDSVQPSAVLFWGGALLLLLRLAWLQPEFTAFDEFSFWGSAAKLTTVFGRLYTVCESGVPWQMTQFAALPLCSFFFQPTADFTAWQAVFAADVLLLAGLCAVLSALDTRDFRLWLPAGVLVLLAPTLFSVSGRTSLLSTAWLEFLGDMPAGVLFGGAVGFWFAARGRGVPARLLTLPVLLLAGNIKSNTFVLALAAAGLIAVDTVLFPAPQQPRGAAGAAKRVGFGIACLAAPAAQYAVWSRYTAVLVAANAQSGGLGDTANVTIGETVVSGIRMLLGGIGENYFEWHREELWQYRSAMVQAFLHTSVSLFGTGLCICILLALLFLAAFLLADGIAARLRVLCAALCSTACYLGYGLMLLLSYAFILKDSTPDSMASYSRYMMSYYIGWFLIALAVLCRELCARPLPRFAPAAVLAPAVLSLGLVCLFVQPQFTVLGCSRGEYASARRQQSIAAVAASYLQPEDKVFLVYQNDTGSYWFAYSEALIPNVLVYGAGGGTYGTPSLGNGVDYFKPAAKEDFRNYYIAEPGVDYILIVSMDDIFSESYAELFTDGLAAAQKGPALYKVTAAGYEPVCQILTGEGSL